MNKHLFFQTYIDYDDSNDGDYVVEPDEEDSTDENISGTLYSSCNLLLCCDVAALI